jgi:hypothetical protein
MGKVIEMKARKGHSTFLIEASDGSMWNLRQVMYAAKIAPRSRRLLALRSVLATINAKPKALLLQFPKKLGRRK